MGRCKSLGSLKSFLWYASQLSGASVLCFHILSLLGCTVGGSCEAPLPIGYSSSRGSSRLRDWTHVSCIPCITGRVFTAEPLGILSLFRVYHGGAGRWGRGWNGVVALMWWLDGCNILCLLIWKAVFFICNIKARQKSLSWILMKRNQCNYYKQTAPTSLPASLVLAQWGVPHGHDSSIWLWSWF